MGIEVEKAGEIATITIRNGTVNPITPAMHRELYEAIRDIEADDAIRVGILTGAGERAFSAGDDIRHEDPGSGDAATDLLAAKGVALQEFIMHHMTNSREWNLAATAGRTRRGPAGRW